MSSKIEVSRELLKEFIDLSIQGRSGDWVNLRNDLRALLAAPVVERQPVEKSQWDVAPNPVLGYADSYRQMARTGTKSIDVWSIITDLERNIAPLFAAPPELAELQAQLDKAERLLRVLRSWQSQAGQEAIDEYFGES
jgi:hypothetical protein